MAHLKRNMNFDNSGFHYICIDRYIHAYIYICKHYYHSHTHIVTNTHTHTYGNTPQLEMHPSCRPAENVEDNPLWREHSKEDVFVESMRRVYALSIVFAKLRMFTEMHVVTLAILRSLLAGRHVSTHTFISTAPRCSNQVGWWHRQRTCATDGWQQRPAQGAVKGPVLPQRLSPSRELARSVSFLSYFLGSWTPKQVITFGSWNPKQVITFVSLDICEY